MTQEEYRRKALEPIVNYIESAMASYSKEELEARIKEALPKKESEDEKIRKGIIELIKQSSNILCPQTQNKMIAYLEKQKDERELSFIEGKMEGVRQTCQEIKDAMSLFETKDLTPFEFTFRDYIDSAIRYCLAGEGYQQYIKEWAADLLNLEKQKEQKPAEKQDMVAQLKEHLANTPREQLEAEWKELEKWNHVGPTVEEYLRGITPAEWSEEDEKMLENAISSINHESVIEGLKSRGISYSIDSSTHLMKNLINWLKSLRPQPHWKPSEEQMRALMWQIRNTSKSSWQWRASEGLYQDLKKL